MKKEIILFIRLVLAMLCPLLGLIGGIGLHTWLVLIFSLLIVPSEFNPLKKEKFLGSKISVHSVALVCLAVASVVSLNSVIYSNFIFDASKYKVLEYPSAETLYELFEEEPEESFFEDNAFSDTDTSVTKPEDLPQSTSESVLVSEFTEISETTKTEPVDTLEESGEKVIPEGTTYVLNKNTKKFHYTDCTSVNKIKAKNFGTTVDSRDDVIASGYSPCGSCKP